MSKLLTWYGIYEEIGYMSFVRMKLCMHFQDYETY